MDLMDKLLVIYYDNEFVLITIQNNFFLKLYIYIYIYYFNSALCAAVPHAIRAFVPNALRTVRVLMPHVITYFCTSRVLCLAFSRAVRARAVRDLLLLISHLLQVFQA